jgi:exosortase
MEIVASPKLKGGPPSSRLNYWLYLKIGLVVALICLLYTRIHTELALDWWNEPALSQGMLIPPFAAYLAWLRRDTTFAHPVKPDNRGLFLMMLACGILLVGQLAVEFFLMRISFVILLAALVWTFWGTARLRTLAFPLLLLTTMVPLPMIVYNALAAPLQLFASDIAAQLARLLGVTVYRDGNIIQLAYTSLGVVEACSGLNSLSALAVASLLLGYLICSRLLTRAFLLVLSIPLAIAFNVLRITGTADHSFSGWLVFLVGFGALYGFAKVTRLLLESHR